MGSNQGDRHAILERATAEIGSLIGNIILRSSIHETEPWGFESPNRFLNQALVVETDLGAVEVLRIVQRIETDLGRVRGTQYDEDGRKIYEDRTIDIDILFYGDITFENSELTVPHPRIAEREFVLVPLAEIMPLYVHPRLGLTVGELLRRKREE